MEKSTTPPFGGAEEEISEKIDSENITKESIVSQINKLYNTISNKYSFRIIRQYCRGLKPNILIQTLIKLVSSLQEGLKLFPVENDNENVPYFKPIDDFISIIKFDTKIQNIILFCSRIESGISILASNANSKKKSSKYASQVTSSYANLFSLCNELNYNNLSSEKITAAIDALESLHESINNFISTLSSPPVSSPTKTKSKKKKQSEKELDEPSSHVPPSSLIDQYWSKQAQSYYENVEKNLHQLLYILNLKTSFETLSKSLHILQNIIDETGNFPECNHSSAQTPKSIKREKKSNDNENQNEPSHEKLESDNQIKSPFNKKSDETIEIKELAAYAKWAEADKNEEYILQAPLIQPDQTQEKKKKRRRSSSKSKKTQNSKDDDIDIDLEKVADILPAKSISQRHMRPYETILDLEKENKKLKELIRQCPHQPEEVRQLREENAALSQKVKELVQELDELESMLHDEVDKIYESD